MHCHRYAILVLFLQLSAGALAEPLGTEFTYQGELRQSGNAASGSFDLEFDLYDVAENGSPVADQVALENVPVVDGVFTVPLDFGAEPFQTGQQLWLQIAVRDGASAGPHTVLTPRQKLTAAPYALASPGGNEAGQVFEQGGNAFGATAVLGTTDAYPLELRIGSILGYPRVLRFEYSDQNLAGGPNLIGGHHTNSVTAGVRGGTIAGGGANGDAQVSNVSPNRVTDHYATVGGGFGNRAGDDDGNTVTAFGATVSGGYNNVASDIATTIAGGDNNVASGYRASISGGGYHQASGEYSAVGGGYGNSPSGHAATVAGGIFNEARAKGATIGGGGATLDSISGSLGTINCTAANGCGNHVSDAFGTVAGGAANRAGSGTNDSDSKWFATVAGGINNQAGGAYSSVTGGQDNTASGDHGAAGGGWSNTAAGGYSAIAGGRENTVDGDSSTIGGGWNNSIGPNFSTIAGGQGNAVTGSFNYGTIGGGASNTVSNLMGTVAGGWQNLSQGNYSAVGGGLQNQANGEGSVVPGGVGNQASGTYSVAMGQGAIVNSNGSFVFSDGSPGQFISGVHNEFIVGATGGIGFYTAKNYSSFCRMAGGGGSWSCSSSRDVKRDFAPIDTADVLQKVVAMPLQSWRFVGEDTSVRHVGPFAQDFYSAFGLGEDDKTISLVDADGIAFAAIQGLNAKLDSTTVAADRVSATKDAEFRALEQEVKALRQAVDILLARAADGPAPAH